MGLPIIPYPADPIGPYELQKTCDPRAKRGVEAFAAWVQQTFGGGTFGIERKCSVGGASEHKEGRALDWKLSADNPADVARAKALFDWLLGPDQDGVPFGNARRVGLMYVIWDGKSWGIKQQQWQTYVGASPHRDHVHFSFTWPGALAQTSFYRWLGVPPEARSPVVGETLVRLGNLTTVCVGMALGYIGARHVLRRMR